ncbi:hypothetical protein HRJ45_12260 [Vibrio coralliilyticus]|uniref:hypothetical protein n=1 Tax=Vibrio coralliilyticus TaxID=190893 RepID=UPI00155FFA97|nr:hypothetical protein [Vibrio coralliilyticus]NRF25490.1 hypothetical protein [Vibrio coralliilyticus]NRF79883.1 hypothetical protein [Vibrio coralliilyticus]
MTNTADKLISNGIDFLERSLNEFKDKPKYSIIHFAIAIEILLKARLAYEHWSLVVAKDPNKKKFESGDFVSVNLDETIKRLKDVVGENISDAERGAFKKVAAHRNRIVHFFHTGVESGEENKEQNNIISEQCECWFHIKSLFLNRWSNMFSVHTAKFEDLDRKMKLHAEYLKAIYDQVKAEINVQEKSGTQIGTCNYCSFKAVPLKLTLPEYAHGICKVCNVSHIQLTVPCNEDECDQEITFVNEGWATCPKCKKKYEDTDLFELINDFCHEPNEYPNNITPANCGVCDGYETVVALREDKFLCVSCFELSDRIGLCDWCDAYSTGDLSNSYWSGCGICEGRSSWEKD